MFFITRRFVATTLALAAIAGGSRAAHAGLDFVVDDFEDASTTISENWGNAVYYGEIDPFAGLPFPGYAGRSFATRSRTPGGGFAGTGVDPAAPKITGVFTSNKEAVYATGALGSRYYRHGDGNNGAISNPSVTPARPLELRQTVGMNLTRATNILTSTTPSIIIEQVRTAPPFDGSAYGFFRVTAYTTVTPTINSAFVLQLETSDTVQIVNRGLASAYTAADPSSTQPILGRPHMSVGPWDTLTTRPSGLDLSSTPSAFVIDIVDASKFKQDSFYRLSTANAIAGLTTRTEYQRNKIDNIWLGWARFGTDSLTASQLVGNFWVDDMMFLEKYPAVELTSTTSVLAEDAPGMTSTNLFAKLSARPTHPVTVTFNTTDTLALTVTPSELTFTPANYDTPQSVTVSSVDQNSIMPREADVLTGIVTQDLFYGQKNNKGVLNVARPAARFYIRQGVPVTLTGHSIGD